MIHKEKTIIFRKEISRKINYTRSKKNLSTLDISEKYKSTSKQQNRKRQNKVGKKWHNY